MDDALLAARAGDSVAFRVVISPHERELRAFCYRMSGSLADADDMLQETLLRAWRSLPDFEGRASLRTWLYRVAWSVCLRALEGRRMRALPSEVGEPAGPSAAMEPGGDWLEPCPATLYEGGPGSPEARYGARESVALAFLAALQLLPARQRAVLLGRDVLGWSAEECAEAFETSVASVNSALQRARRTIDDRAARWRPAVPDDGATRDLLARYIAAWEEADPAQLASLLHAEATFAMPPFPMWLRGPADICASIEAMVFASDGRGAFRFVPTEANGLPALAAYRRGADGAFHPASIHVLAVRDALLAEIVVFLDPALPARFGLCDSNTGGPAPA